MIFDMKLNKLPTKHVKETIALYPIVSFTCFVTTKRRHKVNIEKWLVGSRKGACKQDVVTSSVGGCEGRGGRRRG